MPYIHQFKFFKKSIFGKILDVVLNSLSFWKFKTILFKPFTYLHLRSDIKDVIYLNWLIPFERIQHLIPNHTRIEKHGDKVVLTCLSYKHQKFAPLLLGPFREIFGSPYQSNWRLYLEYPNKDDRQAEGVILFIKNILSSLHYTIGSRLMSNILQAQCSKEFEMTKKGKIGSVNIVAGEANFPDLIFKYIDKSDWKMDDEFTKAFHTPAHFVHQICYQEYAVTALPVKEKLCKGRIKLEFNEDEILPIELMELEEGEFSNWVRDCEFVGFKIPKVKFTTRVERVIIGK